MKQKIMTLLLSFCLVSALTACSGNAPAQEPSGSERSAAEASAQEKAEEAEEDPCKDGHTWTDATCTKPRTCSVCGKTEGEPLGHEWQEGTPNFQQAKTCTRCKETEGDPLKAEFEKKGIAVETEWDKEYIFTMPCYQDESKTTDCKLSFSNLKRVPSDDDLGLKEADGYEWLIFDANEKFDDENAIDYGFAGYAEGAMDYYDAYNVGNGDLGDMYEPGKTDIDSLSSFTVNYNGTDYPDCKLLWGNYREDGGWNEETMTCINTRPIYIRVPVGYDGIVLSHWVIGSEKDKEHEAKKDENPFLIDYMDDKCPNFRIIPK